MRRVFGSVVHVSRNTTEQIVKRFSDRERRYIQDPGILCNFASGFSLTNEQIPNESNITADRMYRSFSRKSKTFRIVILVVVLT